MSFRARAVRNVEYNTITLNAVTSNTRTLTTTVDKNYATIEVIAVSTASGSNNVNVNALRVELTNNTTVTAFVNSTEAVDHIIYFRVTWYFPYTMLQPVQHLSGAYSFTAVSAKGELFYGGFTSTGTGGVLNEALGGVTLGSSTTAIRIGGAVGQTASYCVVDWK